MISTGNLALESRKTQEGLEADSGLMDTEKMRRIGE
jgi:hypothetical protein